MISRQLLQPLVATATVTLLMVLAFGCVPKTPPGMVLQTPKAAWRAFQAYYCVPPKESGLRVRASLYYTQLKPRKRTNRTLMTMWGDFGGTMRLDVSASIGKMLAHIRENGDGLLVFYPGDEEAYTHVNPVLGATRLGMPFPFSLSELGDVLTGDFSGLAPKRYASAERLVSNGGGYRFVLDDGLVSSITLDELGRPVRVEGTTTKHDDGARQWWLEINRYEESEPGAVPLPDKITLALDNGEKGVLHIKSRELMLSPWPAGKLDLVLPEGVEPIRLDNGYTDMKTGEIPVVYEDKQ